MTRPNTYVHACGETALTVVGAFAHLLVCPLEPRRRPEPPPPDDRVGVREYVAPPWSVLRRIA